VGNAEPTSSSFAAWVPHDGEITTSLSNTKYPVTSNEVNLAIGPYGNSNIGENNKQLSQEEFIKLFTNNGNDSGGQYEIIVLGMQEAAFVSKKSAVANLTTSTATERSGNDDSERVVDATTDNNNNNINNNSSGEGNNNNEVSKKKQKSSKKGPLEKAVNKAGMLVRGISANQTYKRK
jgi:hypothetical protein